MAKDISHRLRKGLLFSSGFAWGEMVLGRVGNSEFGEWTVYGNCVNAAKRLQSLAPPVADQHVVVVGTVDAESPLFSKELEGCAEALKTEGSIFNLSIETNCLKGVGNATYLKSTIVPADFA